MNGQLSSNSINNNNGPSNNNHFISNSKSNDNHMYYSQEDAQRIDLYKASIHVEMLKGEKVTKNKQTKKPFRTSRDEKRFRCKFNETIKVQRKGYQTLRQHNVAPFCV